MVRLKATITNTGDLSNTKFQFQYGTIKRKNDLPEYREKLCFNSNMVRLKVQDSISFYQFDIGFNSNMVRLKEGRATSRTQTFLVSIPIWYD